MSTLTKTKSLQDYQKLVNEIYGPSNRRHFTVEEMLTNVSRFSMRALKGIRKNDPEKIKINIVVATSWFMSLMNQLEIDLEDEVWNRFPYLCSYCGECPCVCKTKKNQKRLKIKINKKYKPETIAGLQKMFNEIYPAKSRTLEHAGIHLAEEVGEFSEAVLKFRGHHTDEYFKNVTLEAADTFSCFMGVCNSINFDYEKDLLSLFSHGCHVCKSTPCVCEYDFVINFKS